MVFRDFEFVLKNHEPVRVKHRKCIFVPHDVYSRMRTRHLNLIMQKGSRVVQMIIAHKRFHIIYIFKIREQKKSCVGSGTQYMYLKVGKIFGENIFL